VQADDFIFPLCLESMIGVFEQSATVGLVSAYWLKGSELRGSNFPFEANVMKGPDMARLYLRTGLWVFGSPTAVMYRATLLEKGKPFYDETELHEDTAKCMEILENWDFGFSHQVLSFSRADNESISSAVRNLKPHAIDRYITVQRYVSRFLDSEEASLMKRREKVHYYRVLGLQVFRLPEAKFWQYHRDGLETLNESLQWGLIALQAIREGLWLAINPGSTGVGFLRYWKNKLQQKSGSARRGAASGR
jgi:hypothetical protein